MRASEPGFKLSHYPLVGDAYHRAVRQAKRRPAWETPVGIFARSYEVDQETGCWVWQGRINNRGYGDFVFGTNSLAHRASYLFYKGTLHPSLVLDHLCRNTRCVNPAHLEQVTNSENLHRNAGFVPSRRWTNCRRGHAFDAVNTRLAWNGRIWQQHCRACDRERCSRERKLGMR